MSLFVSCGEVSGDQYAGNLLEALAAGGASLSPWGMGGASCHRAGMEVLWSMEALQLMGVVEVLSHLPRLFRLREELVREVLRRSPRGVVLVDSPDFHLPLARRLRASGYRGPIVNLVPPTVWAWRRGRVRTLRSCMTLCLPLFPFEHAFLTSQGCVSAFRGHPLLDEVEGSSPDEGNRQVAFLPGSRSGEVRRLLPPFLEAAGILGSRGYRPVFSSAPGLREEVRRDLSCRAEAAGFEVCAASGRELLARSACGVLASGTATLEALLLRRPMVVAYAAHPLSMGLARWLVRVPFCALPNLLAGKALFPEFLQTAVTGPALAEAARGFLEAPEGRRRELDEEMDRLRDRLGERGVYPFWAERVAEAVAA